MRTDMMCRPLHGRDDSLHSNGSILFTRIVAGLRILRRSQGCCAMGFLDWLFGSGSPPETRQFRGRQRSTCASCAGFGSRTCGRCGGSGGLTATTPGTSKYETCMSCGGSGGRWSGSKRETCMSCGGSGGRTRFVSGSTRREVCMSCGGMGRIVCNACMGAGWR